MLRLIAVVLLLCLFASAANAEPVLGQDAVSYSARRHATAHDPRPSRWCGWWLRQQLGVADRAFNQARRWARYGSPASSDCVNCIAVWPHHVGLVTGRPGPGVILLKSGNDGHAVRERERSTRGIIAYRYPNGLASR
jgi:hypothetical protein